MKTESFDFFLPDDLIAQTPAPERDRCRLMVMPRGGEPVHRYFEDITEFLSAGDLLILNDTKVFPASLTGRKHTGGLLGVLLVRSLGERRWEVLSRGGYTGELVFSDTLKGFIRQGREITLICSGNLMDEIWSSGTMPLPPYIRRKADSSDREWYQTVFARSEGSIAAPTAGLHFTSGLIERLRAHGVAIRYLTLHIGIGTFRPMRSENVEDHTMDREYFEIAGDLIADIERTRAAGGHVVATGTSTTRAIEGFYSKKTEILSKNGKVFGYTDIFIYPGYEFRAVDRLITNFHLPRSTPLLLTSALAGRERLLAGYAEAIRLGYRFFSYGDAMLVL